MSPIPRWRRILSIALLAVLGLALAVAAFVQAQQRILRWRAEHLLADIRNLELGKSTWADAQRIMSRWGAWGFYEGSCTEKGCSYQIAFRDVSRTFPVMSEPNGNLHSEPQKRDAWLLSTYRILGGRSVLVAARVEVIKGVVWGKGYEVYVNIPAGREAEDEEYVLATYAQTVWRRKDLHDSYRTNPRDYVINRGSPCTGCEIIEASFTPFADPKFISDALNFNLDCLTRLIRCRHPQELAPGMWQHADEDERATKSAESETSLHQCKQPLELLGREHENAVIAQVLDTQIEHGPKGMYSVTTFRLDQRLKWADFWNVDDVRRTNTSGYDIGTWETGRPGLLSPGSKVILMFETPDQFTPDGWIGLDLCDVLPATDENLAAVLRGVRQDVFPMLVYRSP